MLIIYRSMDSLKICQHHILELCSRVDNIISLKSRILSPFSPAPFRVSVALSFVYHFEFPSYDAAFIKFLLGDYYQFALSYTCTECSGQYMIVNLVWEPSSIHCSRPYFIQFGFYFYFWINSIHIQLINRSVRNKFH